MRIAIFGNTMKDCIPMEVQRLLDFFEAHGIETVLSQEIRQELNLRNYQPFGESEDKVDFALSIGGDGTFLTTASTIADSDIPILGINCGNLGFLAEVKTKDTEEVLQQLLDGEYKIEERTLLSVTCSESGHLANPTALNEVGIMKYGLSSMISVEAMVNGELLNNYKGDGLLIATPTGSTAYNMSAGGPLMMPQTSGLILSPIASHSLNVRPLVIPDDWKIDLKVRSRTGSYMISIDGRSQVVSQETLLHIERAPYTIKVVQTGGNDFIHSLKNKLNWGI